MITPTTFLRLLAPADAEPLLHLTQRWGRFHWRVSPDDIATKLRTMPGVVAEDSVGLRGFLLFEPQVAGFGLIIGAGLRDSWSAEAYLNQILPAGETVARQHHLSALMHIGNARWLIQGLTARGFQIREWIMRFERSGVTPPPFIPQASYIRPATPADMPAILEVDRLTFGEVWHQLNLDFDNVFNKPYVLNVAQFQQQIVGYVWYESYHYHVHFTRLAVHPAYQGRGFGGELLQQAMLQVLAQGTKVLTVNTLTQNSRSRALYERFGFRYTNQRMPVLWKPLTTTAAHF